MSSAPLSQVWVILITLNLLAVMKMLTVKEIMKKMPIELGVQTLR